MKLDLQVILRATIFLKQLDTAVAANTMSQMNDQVPLPQVQKTINCLAALALLGPRQAGPVE